jgi:hypothetical protein
MKDLVKKVAVAIATGGLVAQGMITPVLGLDIQVTGNGASSDVDVDVDQSSSVNVDQNNDAHIDNNVDASANTGNNSQYGNTGGNNETTTGDADADVVVHNAVNSNEASVGCGGCTPDLNVEVSGNGAYSDTDLDVDMSNNVDVDQDNDADIDNDVDVDADSGNNEQYGNTGGDNSVETGEAEAGARVDTKANFNAALIDECCGDWEGTVKVAGNGAYADVDLDLDLDSELDVDQDNDFDGDNDVDADADSGDNDQKYNTGEHDGDPSIDTGDASDDVLVSNTGNSNVFSTGDGETPDFPDFEWESEESSAHWLAWFSLMSH